MTRRTSIATSLSVALVGLSGGCTFCWDTVNSQPVAQIDIDSDSVGPHHNNDLVTFDASRSDDPDGSSGSLAAIWRARLCQDAEGTQCPPDAFAIDEGTIYDKFTFAIPETQDKFPILVTLQVRDRRGANADDQFLLEIDNRDPELELQVQGYEVDDHYPIGTAMQVFASASDPDGDPVGLEWTLYPPDDSVSYRFEPVAGVEDAYELEPDVDGTWTVEVTATDGNGGSVTEQIPIVVGEDIPPCIAATDPDAVVQGVYVIDADDDPRRFAVLSVTDDLDVYPPPPDDAEFLGTASFSWSIATPDTEGEFVAIDDHLLSDYFVDPQGFAPGDQVELRVEIADRVDRVIPCDPAQPTCSIGGNSCLQRVTWEVEIR